MKIGLFISLDISEDIDGLSNLYDEDIAIVDLNRNIEENIKKVKSQLCHTCHYKNSDGNDISTIIKNMLNGKSDYEYIFFNDYHGEYKRILKFVEKEINEI